MVEVVGTLGTVCLRTKLPIWRFDDVTGVSFQTLYRFAGGSQRTSIVNALGGSPNPLAKTVCLSATIDPPLGLLSSAQLLVGALTRRDDLDRGGFAMVGEVRLGLEAKHKSTANAGRVPGTLPQSCDCDGERTTKGIKRTKMKVEQCISTW